ncbi:IclR family transcriptional regulator [Streptomyces kronopolitis]|uniref:IclR family transcriptional regulator n=1 Tax=Streptomyces kronopolitis TaxID=1612435 RepID=UPI00367386DE
MPREQRPESHDPHHAEDAAEAVGADGPDNAAGAPDQAGAVGATARRGRTSAAGSALEKSLRILEAVAAPGGPHRLTGITEAAAVPKSSTYRILASLSAQGFVRQEAGGRYSVGPRLRGLSAQVIGGAEPASIGHILDELQQTTGLTVHLALHSGETITCIRKLEGDQPFRTASRIGLRMPLHTTAIGKSILAHLPAEEVRALITGGGLPARTPQTLTTPEALEADLESVRARGFAIDEEENEPGVRCIGAAVLDHAGRPVAGVSLTTVTFLVPRDQLTSYAPDLRAATQALTPLL